MSLLAGHERAQVRVGGAVLVALLLAVGFVVFIADKLELSRQVRFEVAFAHAGPLHAGADVVVAGQVIGEVESVRPAPRGAAPALGGEPGVIARVRVAADRAWQVDVHGEFFVSSRGALSERFLEVGPQPCERRPATRPRECTAASVVPRQAIRAGDQVRGVDPPSMDRVLQRTWDNLQTTRAFVESVRPELTALVDNVAALRATVSAVEPTPGAWAELVANVSALRATAAATGELVGGGAGVDRLRALLVARDTLVARAGDQLGALAARWDDLAAQLDAVSVRLGGAGASASSRLAVAVDASRAALAKLAPLRAHLDELRAWIARGEGSIGKLMSDPEFPEDAKELGKIMKRQPWRLVGHPPDDLEQGGVAP